MAYCTSGTFIPRSSLQHCRNKNNQIDEISAWCKALAVQFNKNKLYCFLLARSHSYAITGALMLTCFTQFSLNDGPQSTIVYQTRLASLTFRRWCRANSLSIKSLRNLVKTTFSWPQLNKRDVIWIFISFSGSFQDIFLLQCSKQFLKNVPSLGPTSVYVWARMLYTLPNSNIPLIRKLIQTTQGFRDNNAR